MLRADHLSRGFLPSKVCVTECNREVPTKRRPWHTRGSCAMKKVHNSVTITLFLINRLLINACSITYFNRLTCKNFNMSFWKKKMKLQTLHHDRYTHFINKSDEVTTREEATAKFSIFAAIFHVHSVFNQKPGQENERQNLLQWLTHHGLTYSCAHRHIVYHNHRLVNEMSCREFDLGGKGWMFFTKAPTVIHSLSNNR